MSHLLSVARSYTRAGLSVFAIDGKTPNTPVLPYIQDDAGRWKQSWKPFQHRLATEEELRRMFTHHATTGLALACGPVSKGRHAEGGLYAIDLDNIAWCDPYLSKCGDAATCPLIQRTGRGGLQLLQVCKNAGELRNEKIAMYLNPDWHEGSDESKWLCGIETRGTGGYVCIAPSRHPNGRYYETLQHAFEDMPFASDEVVLTELEVARSFNMAPAKEMHPGPKGPTNRERKTHRLNTPRLIMDTFESMWTLPSFLSTHGYDILSSRRALRPGGKRGVNMPGVLFSDDGDAAYFFSSNDPLHDYENAYGDPFHDTWGANVGLNYAGDFYLALEVEAEGMGIDYHRPDSIPMPTAPATRPDPIAPTFFGESSPLNCLIFCETVEAAQLIARQGVTACLVPRAISFAIPTEHIGRWTKRYVLAEHHDGFIDSLAATCDALLMDIPFNLTIPELTAPDLFVMLKRAYAPSWSQGANALRKKGH